jgi:hypothetical protein
MWKLGRMCAGCGTAGIEFADTQRAWPRECSSGDLDER